MFFTYPGDFKEMESPHGSLMRLVWGERIMLVYVTIEPNSPMEALHRHPHEQLGVVWEGEVVVTIGNETRKLKKGDAYLVPYNVLHGLAAAPESEVVLLELFSPPRDEFK